MGPAHMLQLPEAVVTAGEPLPGASEDVERVLPSPFGVPERGSSSLGPVPGSYGHRH